MLQKIGRLFSKQKAAADHPLVALLQLRSKVDVGSSLSRGDLKPIPQALVQKITHGLADGDFFTVVQGIEPYFEFSAARFSEEVQHLRGQKNAQIWTIAAVSEIFGFVLALKNDKSLLQNQYFQAMMEGLGLVWDTALGSTSIFLFEELMEIFLEAEGFRWEHESINSFSNYVVDNRSLSDSVSPYITRLLSVASDMRVCDCQCLIDVIRISLVEDRGIVRADDMPVIIEALIPFIEKLNSSAIEVLAISSNTSVSATTMDCFLLLARVSALKVSEMEPTLSIPENLAKSESLGLSDSAVEFVELDEDSFENGFTRCDIPRDSMSESSPLVEFVAILTKALRLSNPECIEVMIKSMIELLKVWEKQENRYDGAYAVLRLISEFQEKMHASTFLDFICDSLIFDPHYTVFDENLPEALNILRGLSVSVLQCEKDASMAQLVVRNSGEPMLVCEILARFTYQKCEQYFIDEECLKSILSIVWGLLKVYSKQKSERVLRGLCAALCFLFSLPQGDSEGIYSTLFCSKSFVDGFVGLVFVPVLRPMVLDKVREFLVQNKTVSVDMLSFYVYNLINRCKDLSDPRCEELVSSIVDMLADAATHNMTLVSSFRGTLNAMLIYGESKPSIRIMQSSMKFINLMMQKMDFHLRATHVKRLVAIIKNVGVSESVLLSLMNLCACATSISSQTLFLIKQHTVIPIAFAAFGESDKLRDLTAYFIELCKFSPSNCIECHKARLDAIFLDFISEFCWNNSKVVSFQGFCFKLEFEHRDIEELLLPFLSLVIHVRSDNAIGQKFMDLILNTKDKQTSMCIAQFVSGQIAAMNNRLRPVFRLGRRDACCHVSSVQSGSFNAMFSFAFWMKIDNPISFESKGCTQILSLKEATTNGHELKVFLNRDALYVSFDKTDLSIQCYAGIKSNKWTFIGFVAKRFSQDQSAIGLFADGHLGFCQEVDRIAFDPDVAIDISIGGGGTDSFVGLIGPFILTDMIFGDDELEVIEQRGPAALESQERFICKSLSSGEVAVRDDVTLDHAHQFRNQHSLDHVLSDYDHYVTLLDLFKQLDTSPDGLVEVCIGIMKQIMKPANDYAGIIRYYLAQYSSAHLSYSLYLSLFSIMEVSQSPVLFDNLVVNMELWSLSSAPSFMRILHHWCHTVVNTCHAMFERPGYFGRLLKMFEHMFIRDGLKDRYSEAEIAKMHASFLSLLHESGRIELSASDAYFMFQLAYTVTNQSLKIELINLVEFLAPVIVEKIPNFSEHFHVFVEDEDPEVVLAAIHAMHNLAIGHLQGPMTTIALQLRTSPCRSQVFERLIGDVPAYPGLLELVCGLALTMDMQDVEKFLEAAETMDLAEANMKVVLDDGLWFLWPVLLLTQLPIRMCDSLYMVLAKCLCSIDQEARVMSSFRRILETAMLFASFTSLRASQCAFDLMLAINAISAGKFAYLLHDFLVGSVFTFSCKSLSQQMLRLLQSSSVSAQDQEADYVECLKINDILTLEEVLNRDFRCCSIVFGLSIDLIGHLEQGSNLQLCSQMAEKLPPEMLERDENLLQYAKYLLSRIEGPVEQTPEELARMNKSLSALRDEVNGEFCSGIEGLVAEIQRLIKRAKGFVFTDRSAISSQCSDYAAAASDISPYADAIDEQSIAEYLKHRQRVADTGNCQTQRSTEICSHFVPSKLELVPDQSELLQFKDVSREHSSKRADLLLSIDVNVHRFGEVTPQHMDVLKSQILLRQPRKLTRVINSCDIDFVLRRGDTAIEIFCFSGSVYLDISPMSVREFQSKAGAFYPALVQKEGDVMQLWLSRCTTKFDYLMVLNLISGRSHHVKDSEPTMPVFDASDPLSLTVKEVKAEAFYLPKNSPESILEMDAMRKDLEHSDITSYAKTRFAKVYHEPPKPTKFVSIPEFFTFPILSDRECTGFISEHLLFVKTPELLCFVDISPDCQVVARVPVALSGACYASEAGVVIVSGHLVQSVLVKSQTASNVIELDIDMRLCTIHGHTFAFVANDCAVIVVRIDRMEQSRRLIVSSHSIQALAINEDHKMVVCETSNCKLMVHSLVSGDLTAVVDLEGAEFDRVLIAPSWGSIVVVVDQMAQIYTANGAFVRALSLENEIKDCYTFMDRDGTDYCVLVDSSNRIWITEVLRAKKPRHVPQKIMQLSTLRFGIDNMGILGLTSEGMFIFVPFPLHK